MATTQNTTGRLGHHIEDPVFLEANRTIYKHFSDRIADFTAFDANLDAAFQTNWKKAIAKFEEHPTDEVMIDGIQEYTDDLNKKKQAVLTTIDELEYYTKRAFPRNKTKLREFGFAKTRYEKDRGTLKMVLDLFVMNQVAGDYTTELTAEGMSGTFRTDFQNEIQSIAQTELAQEYQKRQRTRSLEERVAKYNNVHDFYSRVNAAAKVIYTDKPETRQLFEMFRGEK